MTQLKKIEEYYSLCEDISRKKEYEMLLKKLSNTTDSREFFKKNNEGEVHPRRKNLHTDIINEYLTQCKSQKNPTLHFILGSIGSGKTSLKDKIFETIPKNNYLYINFDEIKLKLPEYEILKKINPKKASYFVQSESAKIAGILKNKAMKKRINIVYEKNVRLRKDNTLRLSGEMKEAFKKKYKVMIHVVFLDSLKEAWKRVQERYKRTKRYVSKEDVKITFQGLFPNLNRMVDEVQKGYYITLYYNSSNKQNQMVGFVWINNNIALAMSGVQEHDRFFISETTSCYHAVLSNKAVKALPSSVKNRLQQLSCLKELLK